MGKERKIQRAKMDGEGYGWKTIGMDEEFQAHEK